MRPETKVALRAAIDTIAAELVQQKVLPFGIRYTWAGGSVILLSNAGDLEKRYGKYAAYMALGTVSKHRFMEALNTQLRGWDIGAGKFRVSLSTPILTWLESQERQGEARDFRSEMYTRYAGNVYHYAAYVKSQMEQVDPWSLDHLQIAEAVDEPITPQSLGHRLPKDMSLYSHIGPFATLDAAWDFGKTLSATGRSVFEGLIETYRGKYYVTNPSYRG